MLKRPVPGIEPLHVSMPRELKSRPSTSPTHPGLPSDRKYGKALHQLEIKIQLLLDGFVSGWVQNPAKALNR